MNVSVQEVRDGLASAMATLTGWVESRYLPQLFPYDTDHLQHHAYAVEAVNTDPIGDRQRLDIGTQVVTVCQVRWAHRVRADAQASDYGAALDAEHDAIKAIMGYKPAGTHVTLDTVTRLVADDGTWLIGSIQVRVLHQLALR